ncbi:hypothetical protein [Haloarchaeobius sp. DFWS5]|uniref:hypothetical protein n=1 Tax=Haloarchaeobius sp. DFWS5 TaxID=3446114 RepID=UPI003EBFF096
MTTSSDGSHDGSTATADWSPNDHSGDEFEHVGLLSQGTNVYYDRDLSMFFYSDTPEADGSETGLDDSGRALEPTETLGEAIEAIGEKTGWDSLSDWANEHLTADENGNGDDLPDQ